ncbi:unnamed protein product [Ilex paraguariensis]|uniref:EXPERA domain-containing protein n=1 Tax=Ilex paraguariensis TaxID=185542 RepID=A0ABC8RCQ4_9AQUA
MVALIKLIDTVLLAFLTVVAVAAPLDVGLCLSPKIQPDFLLRLQFLYTRKYGEYLATQRPGFFVALVWLEVLFMWPLAVLNLYGNLGGRRWFNATSSVFGASYCTAMIAVGTELMYSHSVSNSLLMAHFLFIGCGVLAILRSLLPNAGKTLATGRTIELSGKKKA